MAEKLVYIVRTDRQGATVIPIHEGQANLLEKRGRAKIFATLDEAESFKRKSGDVVEPKPEPSARRREKSDE